MAKKLWQKKLSQLFCCLCIKTGKRKTSQAKPCYPQKWPYHSQVGKSLWALRQQESRLDSWDRAIFAAYRNEEEGSFVKFKNAKDN
uniref:hypothetical protein n=1 Tax=uncultured Allisonella sp. TaxID=339338 RepID=UPI00266F5E46|nr:hypothetical protein [uncultured Allisonella sp.]